MALRPSRLILVFLLLTPAAFADAGPRRVRVPLNLESVSRTLPQEEAFRAPSYLGIGVSTWIPSDLRLGSRLADCTAFGRGSVPLLSAQWIGQPWLQGRGGEVAPRASLGFADLQRAGTYVYAGAPSVRTQEAYLLPAELGVEASHSFFSDGRVRLFVGASALPVAMITERSALDDGRGIAGIAAKLDVGANFRVARLIGEQPLLVTVGLMTLRGRLAEGTLEGTGFQAGLRLGI